MAVTKEEVVEFISSMTVLELSEFIKELEEKFGVSACRRHGDGRPGRRWRRRRR